MGESNVKRSWVLKEPDGALVVLPEGLSPRASTDILNLCLEISATIESKGETALSLLETSIKEMVNRHFEEILNSAYPPGIANVSSGNGKPPATPPSRLGNPSLGDLARGKKRQVPDPSKKSEAKGKAEEEENLKGRKIKITLPVKISKKKGVDLKIHYKADQSLKPKGFGADLSMKLLDRLKIGIGYSAEDKKGKIDHKGTVGITIEFP